MNQQTNKPANRGEPDGLLVPRFGGSDQPLILASGSPRRRQLLAHLGLPFRVVVPDLDEDVPSPSDLAPEQMAEALAGAKAIIVAQRERRGLVLAADTLVVDGDTVLGKPRDAAEAMAMLRRLRGREHRVITGVALLDAAHPASTSASPPPEGGGIDAAPFTGRSHKLSEMAPSLADHVTTSVRMRPYTDAEIAAYVAHGEPFDKAGAYAIQDQAFHPVASYDGCYCNVVGLPLRAVSRLLRQAGLDITHHHLAGLPPECANCPLEV
jgi:predicted house-cleaning NTP pyrophosphatase (Maf/HAM1 superfamily)